MKKNTKIIISTFFCATFFLLLFAQVAPAEAGAGWQVGYNLARDDSQLPENNVRTVIFAVLQWLLLIFTFICVGAFVVAGIMFLTAGGNPQQAEAAKNYVKYAIIGVAVGLSGYVVIAFVDTTMGGQVQTQTYLPAITSFFA